MNIGLTLRTLIKRHGWEAFIFLIVSITLTLLVWTSSKTQWWAGLSWLEVSTFSWLVARVGLSCDGFGTFGGHRVRPIRKSSVLFAKGIFLLIPIGLAVVSRLIAAAEISLPGSNSQVIFSSTVIQSAIWTTFTFVLFISVGRAVGRGKLFGPSWGAWAVLVAFVLLALSLGQLNGGMGHRIDGWGSAIANRWPSVDPRSSSGVKEWQWLRSGYYGGPSVGSQSFVKIPLKEGSSAEVPEMNLKLVGVSRLDKSLVVEFTINEASDREFFELEKIPVMIAFENGYFGDHWNIKASRERISVPLLSIDRLHCRMKFFTPMVLPENELSWDEVMEGAELWIARLPDEEKARTELFEIPYANKSSSLTELLAGSGRLTWDVREPQDAREKKIDSIRASMGSGDIPELLATAPWSQKAWEDYIRPFLKRVSQPENRQALLERFKHDPRLWDLFADLGWTKEAEPILRKHFGDGKTLSDGAVIYLSQLGEESMGAQLENQFLRIRRDFDAMENHFRKHPGVDWDRVRNEAWRRVIFGFDANRKWTQWGAEIGEKEALRRMLVRAVAGQEEQQILREWFGEGAVSRLRNHWDSVAFADDRWQIGE